MTVLFCKSAFFYCNVHRVVVPLAATEPEIAEASVRLAMYQQSILGHPRVTIIYSQYKCGH